MMPKESVMEQLRRERAAQYRQLDKSQRPRVEPCPDCQEPPYAHAVCPVSGVFHERNRQTIIGGAVVESHVIRSSQLMDAIDKSRVRWVESRTQLVRADASALNLFQSYVRQLDWAMQRYGILYGTYDDALKTIEVHAVYEPEQHGDAATFHFLPDKRTQRVDRLAELLGLRRVGAVCTHPPRDPDVMVLNSREMLLCAREQSRFGDECVLLTMGPNHETGRIECQAWQTSPQAVHFFRLGSLQETDLGNVATAKCVRSDIPLEVAQQDTDDKGHPRVVTRAASNEVDTRWFTSYVAVQQFESPVVRNLFMRISRPGMEPPTLINLRNYMEDPKRREMSFVQKMSDFHVLLFLAETILTVEDDMPVITGAITKRLPEADVEHYETLLATYMSA